MQAKLSFYGAAKNVTGSRYLLETDGVRVLVDCGMYQERHLRDRNWDRFPVDPGTIDAVLLTHAHLDHCGYLPKLAKEGFEGPIYCTAATAEIARIILLDSAHIQEEDAEYKRKRHAREGRRGAHPDVPLYDTSDAEHVLPQFRPIRYREPVALADGVEATFFNAGHVLGAASVRVRCGTDGDARTVLFSGDVGRPDVPILKDPDPPDTADYVVCESTYGDRTHHDLDETKGRLADAINTAVEAGGNVVIPSFALERSQDLLYRLNELRVEKRIPHLLVFVDSPMAINVTEVFERHPELYDEEMKDFVASDRSPFDFKGLKMTRTTGESKAINRIRGTVIIIAGSGMCTGGRIKHHLVNNISHPESTVLFVGYQASGTLGRIIMGRPDEVRIHGRMLPVRARIERINAFSAHADRTELTRWLGALNAPPRTVFVTHGEPRSAEGFAEHVRTELGWEAAVPDYKDTVELT